MLTHGEQKNINILKRDYGKVLHFTIMLHLLCNPLFLFPDLPDQGPEVLGGQPRYNVGDQVNVSCISRNSLPAAMLAWYINGEKADPVQLRTYPEMSNGEGLKTSRLGLVFKVNSNLLLLLTSWAPRRCPGLFHNFIVKKSRAD
jgi:hypothetical protein